ncbi:MAG: ABC transporter permease [Bryobacteraceae bacterium]
MTTLSSDVRFALRALRRNPLFTAVALLSLSLGIGANTAIFTLMDQLMLRQLPIRDPQELVMLYQEGAHNGSNMGYRMHSYPIYQDYQKKAEPLSEVICRRLLDVTLGADGQTERIHAELVSGNYFSMLGVKPALGRVFNSKEDDRVVSGHPSVVLGYDYWMTRFAGERGIIGKKILVNNYPMTVVGVSAAGFAGLDPASAPQIRVPILMKKQMAPEWWWLDAFDRRSRWVQVFARLKPGYTVETAAPVLQGLFTQIRNYEMTLPAAKDWTAYSRQRFMDGKLKLVEADTGQSDLRRSFSTALIVLMCMVGLVLLIACANVANLLVARAVSRQKEIAVRLAIGASRWQLIRQLLVESMTLASAGGVCGVVLAFWMTRGLLALIPTAGNPLLIRPEPDPRILLFALGVSLVTGLIFGLAPALRASRPDLWSTLKDVVGSVTSGGGGTVFFRKGLVTVQVALSFLLLFGSGLFVRSLQNLQSTDTGFDEIENLVTFRLSPAMNGYGDERVVQLYASLLDRVRGLPGVKEAGAAAVSILSGDEWDSSTSVEGHTAKDGEDMQAFMNAVTPGYFEAMGTKLLEGRMFDRRDLIKESKAVVVNRKFARHFFGERSAVGRHIGRGTGPRTKVDIEIVGVVEDSLYEGPREGVRRQVFIPMWGNGGAAFYVRARRDAEALYADLRREVKGLDAALPIYDMKTVSAQLNQTLLSERLMALLSAGFGLLATLLAAIGLYGVMAFVVARRTREIGLRMALGAPPGTVLMLVMREVLTLVAIGLAVGLPAAMALGRFVESQLFGIQARDPWLAVGAVAVLLMVAGAAGMVPAGRAARLDPMLALRQE